VYGYIILQFYTSYIDLSYESKDKMEKHTYTVNGALINLYFGLKGR